MPDGDALRLGQSNRAATRTRLEPDGGGAENTLVIVTRNVTGLRVESSNDIGVRAVGATGVLADATGTAVHARSSAGTAVIGDSSGGIGVHASGGTGVFADATGTAVHARSSAGTAIIGQSDTGLAGHFGGDVRVEGDITLVGADCAEYFSVPESAQIEPGMALVINQEDTLLPCEEAYDRRVAGVVSGAGDLRPGILLDGERPGNSGLPLAMVGKVYCRVDAQYSSIEVGDLLTTSPTVGHAMRAVDPLKAFGAVIGKALRPLRAGRGLIPILVALQ
jgi:hypothetical protein